MARPRRYPAATVVDISKTCSKCRETRLLSQFNKDKNSSDGWFSTCKACQKENYNLKFKGNTEHQKEKYKKSKQLRQLPLPLLPVEKKCSVCLTVKSVDQFNKKSTIKDGLMAACRACTKAINKDWRSKNTRPKEKIKRYNLKKYQLTLEGFYLLREMQGDRCAICKCEMSLTRQGPCIDHCHSSGRIRGLLCSSCNRGLGHFKDRPEFLVSAAEYIKKSRGE